eukprot:scaffold113397_cov18-Tisochrysis_lutea.AAC.2
MAPGSEPFTSTILSPRSLPATHQQGGIKSAISKVAAAHHSALTRRQQHIISAPTRRQQHIGF